MYEVNKIFFTYRCDKPYYDLSCIESTKIDKKNNKIIFKININHDLDTICKFIKMDIISKKFKWINIFKFIFKVIVILVNNFKLN